MAKSGLTILPVVGFLMMSTGAAFASNAYQGDDVSYTVNPREDVELVLGNAAAVAKKAKIDVITHPREGDPADAILDVAEENEADLVMVGNKGMTGARRFLLGSVPNKISHHAPCDVWIVKTT